MEYDNDPQVNDDRYWKWGIFYYNPDDKRWLPPKRNPSLGWTVNFANPLSVGLMVLFIILGLMMTLPWMWLKM